MENDFYYYIAKAPYDNLTKKSSDIPVITKMKKNLFPLEINWTDKNQGEGPFSSLYELIKRSFIFSSIKSQKLKDRVSKSKNIKEIKDLIFTKPDSSYEKTFIDSLHHMTVGKISRQKVKGVHFYHPDRIRIIKKISIEETTGIYSAKIEKLNENTEQWIEKDEITTFFPDSWSMHQLFHECAYAYENKTHDTGNIYLASTPSGVQVKFIIDENEKIITFFPVINNPQ